MNIRTRAEKVKLLKDLLAGKAVVTDLLPAERYTAILLDGVHHIHNTMESEVLLLKPKAFDKWIANKRATCNFHLFNIT